MSYSIEKNDQLIRVKYEDTLDNTDIQGVLKDALIMNDKESSPTNRIEDMRTLKGSKVGFDTLSGFTENIRNIQLSQAVKSAILTSNALQFGIARMFQSILEHPQIKVKIFSNEEEAYNWLSEMDEGD
jgi:hypothetical protein